MRHITLIDQPLDLERELADFKKEKKQAIIWSIIDLLLMLLILLPTLIHLLAGDGFIPLTPINLIIVLWCGFDIKLRYNELNNQALVLRSLIKPEGVVGGVAYGVSRKVASPEITKD